MKLWTRVALGVFAATFAALIVASVVFAIRTNHIAVKAQHASATATRALCLQKKDVARNIKNTRDFLQGGGHIGGVSDALLRRGLRVNEQTLANLKDVQCPDSK